MAVTLANGRACRACGEPAHYRVWAALFFVHLPQHITYETQVAAVLRLVLQKLTAGNAGVVDGYGKRIDDEAGLGVQLLQGLVGGGKQGRWEKQEREVRDPKPTSAPPGRFFSCLQ